MKEKSNDQEKEKNSSEPVSVKGEIESPVPTSTPNSAPTAAPAKLKTPLPWRIIRLILYIGAMWSLLIYYWGFLGILFGIGLFLLEKDKVWSRHGLFIAFIIGSTNYLMDTYKVLWLLLAYLIFFVYIIAAILIPIVQFVIKAIRKSAPKQKKEAMKKTARTLNTKIRLGIKILAVITPILLWGSVNVQFEVMLDNKTALLWIHSPSTVGINEEFFLTVEAWDSFERISASYQGTVEFSLQSYNLSTGDEITASFVTDPDPYTFTGKSYSSAFVPAYELSDRKDFGLHTFPLQIGTPGIHYILVEDSLSGNTFWSNPIIIDNFSVDAPKLAWGDIHSHTMVSDACSSFAAFTSSWVRFCRSLLLLRAQCGNARILFCD